MSLAKTMQSLGAWTMVQGSQVITIANLPYVALKAWYVEREKGRSIVVKSLASQIYYSAVEPVPIFLFIALLGGVVIMVVADGVLRPTGLAPKIPIILAQAVVREFVPLVIAMVLVGRSGTAISTELGNMRVNYEIDGLEAVGVNIDYFLVLPRIFGLSVAAVSLTIVCSVMALVGGYFVSDALGLISLSLRLFDILGAIAPEFVGYSLTKAILFGSTIASVNCFHGLAVGRSVNEVPRANVRAAVQCYIFCFSLNAILSLVAFLRGDRL